MEHAEVEAVVVGSMDAVEGSLLERHAGCVAILKTDV